MAQLIEETELHNNVQSVKIKVYLYPRDKILSFFDYQSFGMLTAFVFSPPPLFIYFNLVILALTQFLSEGKNCTGQGCHLKTGSMLGLHNPSLLHNSGDVL